MGDPVSTAAIITAIAGAATATAALTADKPKAIAPRPEKATGENIAAAAERQRRKAAAAAGQKSTILTGPGGLAPVTGGFKTILGG